MSVQLQVKENDVVIPGDVLGSVSKYTSGTGTCVRQGNVCSTLSGRVRIVQAGQTDQERSKSSSAAPAVKQPVKSVLTVHHPKEDSKGIPKIGSRTICKVININERQAKVNMMNIEGKILLEPLHGVIRREDVRAMEKDSVEIFKSFHPQDMVCARVIALGEGQTYVLSTAENELGVVSARCQCGGTMIPVSWCEMQCVETGDREKRKVAKVANAASMS